MTSTLPQEPRVVERERQKAATETLLGTGIPSYLRVALRAFHETFEPAVQEKGRAA